MPEYPDSCPKNFAVEMLPRDAVEYDRNVFRVAEFGEDNPQSFLSTIDSDNLKRLKYPNYNAKKRDPNDPATYATSCWVLITDQIRTYLGTANKRDPAAALVYGITKGCCGPSNIDKDEHGNDKGHVNWWIYKGAEPHKHFCKVVLDEL
jgi:hypothetical protein